MIECPNCGEDEELRGVALDDGRRQITCDQCGHTWARGEAKKPPAPPARAHRPRATSGDCAPRWDDDADIATLNRYASSLERFGPGGVPEARGERREQTWTVGALVRTKRVFSYIVVHDSGFSSHPFHGLLTLACCKPLIRKTAAAGDIIVGLSSRSERVVYAVQVADVIGFEEYWADPEYEARRPVMNAQQIVYRTGDNIYEPVSGGYRQLPSFHSNRDGSENPDLKPRDLGGPVVQGPQAPERVGAGWRVLDRSGRGRIRGARSALLRYVH